MKMVSWLALAAAVVAASPALPAALAAQIAAPTTLTPALRTAVVTARAAIEARNLSAADTAVGQAEAAAATDYERYVAQSLRLLLENARSQGRSDADRATALAPVLDALIANPALPADELGQRLYERGTFAIVAKKNAEAAQFFARARTAGFSDTDLLPNIVRAKVAAGDVAGGIADLEAMVASERAAGRKVPESWYKYAIARLDRINSPRVGDWTAMWLRDYNTSENWRAAVVVATLQGANAVRFEKNKLDLYRLIYATRGLAGEKDYLDYATAALNTVGSVEEARTVLKEGAAAGAIPAGSATAATIQSSANTKLAKIPAAAAREKLALAGKGADLARQAGDAYFCVRNFAKAAEMYRLAASRGEPDVDRNNLHLGMAQALAGNPADAATALAAVTAEPYLSIARLWTIYVSAPPPA